MLYFQILAVVVGLFILSDPFKAHEIEEPTAVQTPHTTPPSLEEKDKQPVKGPAKSDLKEAATKAALEEFKPDDIMEAVKKTHAARLEETQQREEARKAAGISTTTFDTVLDVIIPSVKKGGWFILSEVIPRAFNVVVKTAPVWMPIVLALL